MEHAAVSRSTARLRVVILAVSAFIFNTTEFIPVGLLSDIAASFDANRAGRPDHHHLRPDRRRCLVGVHAADQQNRAPQAADRRVHAVYRQPRADRRGPNFTTLVISRAGVALAHSVFWSITASLAIRVAPPCKKARALSLLAGGTALAMVLGLPLGRVVGQLLGWRMTLSASRCAPPRWCCCGACCRC